MSWWRELVAVVFRREVLPKGVHHVSVRVDPPQPDTALLIVEVRCTWHPDVSSGVVTAALSDAASTVRRRVIAADLADNGDRP